MVSLLFIGAKGLSTIEPSGHIFYSIINLINTMSVHGLKSSKEPPVMLELGGVAPLSKFTGWMSIDAKFRFGDLGRLIKRNEYYIPPIVPVPPNEVLGEANDPWGFALERYRDKDKERTRVLLKMVSERTNIYGHIMIHLSDGMKLALRSFTGVREPDTGVWTIPDWATISDETDVKPLILWRAIVYVHTHPNSGSSCQSKEEANRVFTNLMQRSGESDWDFKKNFDLILLGSQAIGIPLTRDRDQELLFISSKLDPERHESIMNATKKAELLNNADVPTSLVEAYHRLTNWSTDKKKAVAPTVSTVDHVQREAVPPPLPTTPLHNPLAYTEPPPRRDGDDLYIAKIAPPNYAPKAGRERLARQHGLQPTVPEMVHRS